MWQTVLVPAGGASAQQQQRRQQPGSEGEEDEVPESIADLRLGDMLHEFTERKHALLSLNVWGFNKCVFCEVMRLRATWRFSSHTELFRLQRRTSPGCCY